MGVDPHVESAAAAARRAMRERASEERLAAAWRERDAMLDGEEAMTGNGKTYSCKQCGATFDNRYKLAGHVSNQHRQHGRKARRVPKAKANGAPARCPTCAQQLPSAVSWVAQDFTREGVAEELAAKLAAKAYGLLRVPE